MANADEEQDFAAVGINMLRAALQQAVPVSDHDVAVFDQMVGEAEAVIASTGQEGVDHGAPGIWSLYLQIHAKQWHEAGWRKNAVALPQMRSMQHRPANPEETLIDAAIDAYCAMALYTDDNASAEAASVAVLRMARAMEAVGRADMAFNVVAVALELANDIEPHREEVARYGLSLARCAGKTDQVAACSTALAESIAVAADTYPVRRLEAFDACEQAVEAVMNTVDPIRSALADQLAALLLQRHYLRNLAPPLMLMIPDAVSASTREKLEFDAWPQRIERLPKAEWMTRMRGRLAAQQWEWEVEKARFALEPAPVRGPLYADWTNWTIDHQAYRRAVPHLGSFLREQNFDRHFLELTHELTHVFSMLGGLGRTLACLRAAAVHAEWSMWAGARHDVDTIRERIISEGVMPLEAGNAVALFRSEQCLELTLKMRVLQDTWSAWFEGLAMFGELSADPTMDADEIGHVNGCLRNLVDFEPTREQMTTHQQRSAAFEEHIAEFETRCSSAIRSLSRANLRRYLEHRQGAYLSGYLAVRAVVSRWRRSTGKSIAATHAFDLLLHATRYAIGEAMPDLSLPLDAFAVAVGQKMNDWVAALARVDSEEINTFLIPVQRDAAGKIFHWDRMHVRLVDEQADALIDAEEQQTRQAVRQALRSLTQPLDVMRVAEGNPDVRALIQCCADVLVEILDGDGGERIVDRQYAFVLQTLRLNSLLPIGRTQAKFFVNDPPDASTAYLGIQLRTTEQNRDTGQPGANEVWMPISHDDAAAIESVAKSTNNPRMDVVRVIDLAGWMMDDPARQWTHFLSLHYGEWQHLDGTSQASRAHLAANPSARREALDLLRARLYPSGILGAEMHYIARGESGARRTLQGTANGVPWICEGIDASAWARHVHELASRVVDESGRAVQQRAAGLGLLHALHIDERIWRAVQHSTFSDMTASFGQRGAIIDALLATALDATEDATIASLAQDLAAADLPLFEHGPAGWDVFPAK